MRRGHRGPTGSPSTRSPAPRPLACGPRRAAGISTTATSGNHSHPAPDFRRLADAPDAPLVLSGHPVLPDLIAPAHEILAAG
ncbi:hypothetical protein ACFW93_32705 [Streptomyces canus]|uniref:hypothetical protein n=1 Tax=Streptomyces canus TaxID=58343 RepID=UPI00368E8FC5